MDPVLYKSIVSGDLSSLSAIQADVILNQATISNNTALHVAAQSGVLNSAEAICAHYPSLLDHQNAKGDTPLHIAAGEGRTEIAQLIVESQRVKDLASGGLGGMRALLGMTNKKMDTALHMAVRNNHFEVVRLLTEADPELDYVANEAGETPLYLAAEDGRYQMVDHILTTCPSPPHGGPDGRTSLHAAILRNQSEITSLLIKKNQDLIKEVDKMGWTPLHCAAWVGNVSVIKDVTERFPDIWEAVDEDGRNFLHVAAKYNQIEVVKYVLGNKEMTGIVLNGQTTGGNTPLHFAAYMEMVGIFLLLVSDKRVNLSTMNAENLTAFDLAQSEVELAPFASAMKKPGLVRSRRKEILEAPHGKTRQNAWDSVYLRLWKERVNSELVVNALVATVSFTAGLTVPGGFITQGRYEGTAVLSKKSAFQAFSISNTMAMWLSVSAILNHFLARAQNRPHTIFRLVVAASWCSFFALFAMVLAFVTGSYAVLSVTPGLAITVCIIGCSFFCYGATQTWVLHMKARIQYFFVSLNLLKNTVVKLGDSVMRLF